MVDSRLVILDDRLLIEELLAGLPALDRRTARATTSLWYYRACRAATIAAGGYLSGPFLELAANEQERAVTNLLELPEEFTLAEPRRTVPTMARLAQRHPTLNVLNLEAVAAAEVLDGTVWLSAPAGRGVLPGILHAEGIPWRTLDLD